MRAIWAAVLLVVLVTPAVGWADAGNCMTAYYKTKEARCVDDMLASPKAVTGPSGKAQINPSVLGFVAGVFKTDPQEKARLLALDVQPIVRELFAKALFMANLGGEVRAYAEAKGLAVDSYERMKASGLRLLEDITPVAMPAENDILIGAYMASGNSDYIRRILQNFTGADDEVVRIAFRLALMQSKFGPTMAAPNREKNVLLQTVCEKYECKKDPRMLMRIMTLTTAFWAMQSLSREDEGIKETANGFFQGDPRLNRILAIETNAFGNYLTTLALFAAVPDKANVNEALSIYEHLGTDKEATAALMEKK